ncbi:MAG TPA: creatininase family protein [Planctomycetota bacterium]|nr:creatininase family protein [Planctomycetota bacterium]
MFLPVGAIEPHGPHLPLATDSILATEAGRRAARKLAAAGREAFVAPAIPFATTEFARDFPGAVSVPAATATAYVRDVAVGLVREGAARVVIVTFHFEPAHVVAMRKAAEEATKAAGAPVVLADLTRRANVEKIGGEFATGSCHAGAFESSLVLAARPELVRDDLRSVLPEHFVPLPERMKAGATSFVEAGMPQSYCGSPADGSTQEGERLYGVITEILVTFATA